ncbi:2-succinyl-5-enolpyruvyl-6-hydroxy-3-cyclohexene-1-carboxylic-acid synthase [Agromyces sp. H3Y2-19a]|uniref:2-succinyl-5-enolpyruvyl-6-hydroxy-3- cyclohexene-1-carboxylic-acid synthase n=1 Tax=Agromyces chromiiresistens TaxID=3030835 RepID=UPI0023B980EE|nr:2-succinyl-5-enolpyruvyl-6-hydroxy-3-cyclohexene-1-carboxylic-acid synthase [Agromyces chromiiresistens]MDF0513854.1 2-succinyl-5-enolpyruvyl-6-hydroxy-3-cyclohexene-1-carboxylic-acid synthase [Agromyces chromiiresistens]
MSAGERFETAPATAYSVALFDALTAAGVTDVVVAPGSRSQALALAAAEFERLGRLRLHVRIDERGAGFLALGLAVETGRPAVVVTTSGTAVANLHPAVLEAHHSGVPLVLLTSDRPAEMRGIRSNQTTMQPGMFAGAVRLERDATAPEGAPGEPDAAARLAREAVAAALGLDLEGGRIAHPGPGPVHLNLQLREPLSSAWSVVAGFGDSSRHADNAVRAPGVSPESPNPAAPAGALIARGPRTVVVAGAGAGPEAEAFARAGDWPLIAEVTSGAHFGPNLVVAYRELLREAGFGDQVQRVVVFGHPTLSREVPALVQRDDVESIVVAPSGVEWFNPGRRVRRFERAVHADSAAPSPEERAWVRRWVHASRILVDAGLPTAPPPVSPGIDETGHVHDFEAHREFMRAQLDGVRAPITRRMLVDAIWAATWPHDRLVFGASRLIRDADRAVPGRRIAAHANRGLAGIDGTVATALGIAIASQADASAQARSQEDASARLVEGRPTQEDASAPRVEGRATQEDASRNPTSDSEPLAAPPLLAERDLSAVLAAAEQVERSIAAAAEASRGGAADSSTTRALIGDLTLLHDVGSMLIGAGEARPRLLVIVGNDGGGTIFDSLEVAGTAPADAFDRVQYTPQNVDLAALATAYGWDYVRATTRGELDEALAKRVEGPTILEVPLPR